MTEQRKKILESTDFVKKLFPILKPSPFEDFGKGAQRYNLYMLGKRDYMGSLMPQASFHSTSLRA